MQFLSAPLFHLPHFQLGSENASSSSKPRMAKDDYNSQGYSTDGHYQVLLIWLYLQQPEQALFQYQDSIIVQPQNEHRDWTESIFPILNLSFLTFFFFSLWKGTFGSYTLLQLQQYFSLFGTTVGLFWSLAKNLHQPILWQAKSVRDEHSQSTQSCKLQLLLPDITSGGCSKWKPALQHTGWIFKASWK